MPILTHIESNYPDVSVDVFLTPDPYASDREHLEVKKHPVVRKVYQPNQTKGVVFSFKRRLSYDPETTAVLFLGGDHRYCQFLSMRYRLPLYGYSEHRRLNFRFRKVFRRDDIGDLMKDVVRDCSQKIDQRTIQDRLDLTSDRYCLFLPGSKPALFRYLIPFYIDLVQYIKKDQPDFNAALLISSFISPELIIDLSSKYDLSDFILVNNKSPDDLCLADLVVTVPGSLTVISAYLMVPVIMLLPLDSADAIVYHGPLGRLLRLPRLGRLTLSVVRFILARRKKWFALPNIIASKEIIPEIVGILPSDAAAAYVSRIFYDPVKLVEMRNRLREFNKQQDNQWPSRTILEYILDR